MTNSTPELLRLAATIAQRFEHKGEPITPTEAIDRAEAAREQIAQLKAMHGLGCESTVAWPVGADLALAE